MIYFERMSNERKRIGRSASVREDVTVLEFSSRGDFREWLVGNSETSEGVWLVFGKKKPVATLSANDALEEALCFGWIDGQMQSIDDTKYHKYFAKRRANSVWSEKNKQTVEALRSKGLMTERGEKAVEAAKRNGAWDVPKREPITDEQIDAFTEKLAGILPAYENFQRMSQSVRRTYTGRYLSFKTEEARAKDFERIIERLNKNLKPM
jgi:uncharacterized protein YdeI (YjbR/CyaY-like superfamily)